MPIHFEELEKLLMSWKNENKFKKPENSRAAMVSYRIYNRIMNEKYKKNIRELINTLDIDDIDIINENIIERDNNSITKSTRITINQPRNKL